MPGKAAISFGMAVSVLAACMVAMPVSVQRSHLDSDTLSLRLNTALAADMSVRVRRHRHHYGVVYGALFDPYCGGPYVGGGWNGGTYWGGPWMDLGCYGVPY